MSNSMIIEPFEFIDFDEEEHGGPVYPPEVCMYARSVLTGIGIKFDRGFLNPAEYKDIKAVEQRDQINDRRQYAAFKEALSQYKRTHLEWPTCKYGGEIMPISIPYPNKFSGYILALKCDNCSELQDEYEFFNTTII